MRHTQICSHLESSDATRIGLVVSYDACTNCSYLKSSDATRIGLVVSFDDIHVMTMNVIMIYLWNVDI